MLVKSDEVPRISLPQILPHTMSYKIFRVAPVQERGRKKHPPRESHRRTEISAARADRNLLNENVCISVPQAHLGHRAVCAGSRGLSRYHPAQQQASTRQLESTEAVEKNTEE